MEENLIYITGHRNPDTDAICSALSYAYLKRQLGFNAVAIRLGNVNSETKFVLNKFGVEAPEIKYDIKPTIRDIEIDDPIIALAEEPIKDVWYKMIINKKNTAAVVSENGELIGLVSITDITNALLSLSTGNYRYLKITPIENIVTALSGNLVYHYPNYETTGQVLIASSVLDDVTEAEFGKKIAITSTRVSTQERAIKAKSALLISTRSEGFEDSIIELAKENDCSLISTTMDLISVAQTITQAIPIGKIMTTDLVTFNIYDYLENVREVISKSRFRQYPVIDNNKRLVGMISRYHLFNATKKKIILVDHNERSQSIEGIEEAEILEIIDHHRLGDIQTDLPVYFRNEICGSSCTIISELFEEADQEIPKEYAGIMLCAIISDTMNFHSPTCTRKDHRQAEKLARIAGVSIEDLGVEILQISASLKTKSASEIVNNDIKEFNINSYRVSIGQVNITSKEDIITVREEVLVYMDSYCQANRLDLVAMLFSLINGEGSYLLTVGRDATLFNEAFEGTLINEEDLVFLPNIISRKKQVIPIVAKHLQVIRNS